MWGIETLIILAMVGVNGLLAGYEIALASVTVGRLQVLAQEGRRGAKAALYMKQHVEASLAAVQIGITLAGAIAAAVGGAGAKEVIAPMIKRGLGISGSYADFIAIALVVLPLTVVTIIFGELVPKVFTLRNKEWVCLALSPAMQVFTVLVRPGVWFLERAVMAVVRLTEGWWRPRFGKGWADPGQLQELRACAAWARLSRLIGSHQERIIVGAADLSARPVKQIMLPANQIKMLNLTDSLMDSLVAAHQDMHTRFPVTQRPGDPQAIVGYVTFKDLVAYMKLAPEQPSLQAITRAIVSFKEDMPLASCLEELIRQHQHIALIRDQAGHVVGMITMEDILEELVGEIEDEYDRLPTHVVSVGTAWLVGGGVGLDKLKDATGLDLTKDLPTCGAKNLSEWIIGHKGQPPQGGQELHRSGIRFLIRKVRRQKVMEAQVSAQSRTALPG